MDELPGHTLDDEGEQDPDACYDCLIEQDPVKSACKCGKCCELLIEVHARDAEREPKIADRGSPILAPPDASGTRELIGYLLNAEENGGACAFLDRTTRLCAIYESRPLICRVYDCDTEGREQLIELGMIER